MLNLRRNTQWFKNNFCHLIEQLMKPCNIINLFLSLSYIIAKYFPSICELLFNESGCEFDYKDTCILVCLVIVLVIKAWQIRSMGYLSTDISFLSSSFAYAKIANLMLWLYANIYFGILYGVTILLCGLVLNPESVHQGTKGLRNDLFQLLKPRFLIGLFLSMSYVIAKKFPYVCELLFKQTDCKLDDNEVYILFFLMIVVVIKGRRKANKINYILSSFVYAKIANLILWFYADVLFGILYGIIILSYSFLLPEPIYDSVENIIYFHGEKNLQEELQRDRRIIWLIAFYATWDEACVNFAPMFSELSTKYVLDNLKFGIVNIGRYPDVAAKYRINYSCDIHQRPTLILFKQGKEIERKPDDNSPVEEIPKEKLVKFLFSVDNIANIFNLKGIYDDCHKTSSKTEKIKKNDKKPIKSD